MRQCLWFRVRWLQHMGGSACLNLQILLPFPRWRQVRLQSIQQLLLELRLPEFRELWLRLLDAFCHLASLLRYCICWKIHFDYSILGEFRINCIGRSYESGSIIPWRMIPHSRQRASRFFVHWGETNPLFIRPPLWSIGCKQRLLEFFRRNSCSLFEYPTKIKWIGETHHGCNIWQVHRICCN